MGCDMDTLAFFQKILPETGPYYLALIDSKGRTLHKSYDSLERLSKAAIALDAQGTVSVYHACASWLEASVEVPQPDGTSKKAWRHESNRNRAKSLWVDIDCGEDKAAKNDGYLTKRDAALALMAFCKRFDFPKPLVVDSGNGVHGYWPMTKALKPEVWQKLADALKTAAIKSGLLIDRKCTSDFARILRPVGTTNRKGAPKPVVAKNDAPEYDPQDLAARLKAILAEVGGNVVETFIDRPAYLADSAALNEDLTAHAAPTIPSSAVEVANHCKQVAMMRDTKGDVGYEHWRGVIGIIKHCEEGIDLAHEWSEEREATGHAQVDVETKYNTWSSSATTCEFFSQSNPTGCEGCQYKGKIKSPIVLGRYVPEPEEKVVEAEVEGQTQHVQIPKFPATFEWKNNKMVRYVKDKDDVWQEYEFCQTLFYPIYRVRNEDGTYSIGMRVHKFNGKTQEFLVNTGLLATPARLLESLGDRGEIIQTNNRDAAMHLTAFLRSSVEELKRQADELNTMTSYGWKNDMTSFLIGDRLYCNDGTVRKVLVSGYAADMIGCFPPPKGSVDGYARALNHVYNRPGMECMQYAIISGYGSILTPMGEPDYHGLTVALTGEDTGKGKTTACKAAMYGFGLADEMTIKGDKGATINGRYGSLAGMGSLPILMDEVTNISGKELSEFVYTLSNGEEKIRQTTSRGSGVRMAARGNWNLSLYLTGNKDLHEELSMVTSNSQAEAVRMAQIRVDNYPIPQLNVSEVGSAVTQMRMNAGSAGDAFVRYVTSHINEVWGMVQDNLADVGRVIPDPAYRFFRNHMAVSLTAGQIMRDLGICNFDIEELRAFALSLMQGVVDKVQQTNVIEAEDALNSLINDLSPRILTTNEYRDSRDARGPEITGRISGSQGPAGRYIRVNPNSKDPLAGRLYLVKKDMREWCQKHRVDLTSVIKWAAEKGVLVSESERFTVGRGTEHATSNLRCIVFNLAKLMDSIEQHPSNAKFILHKGGLANGGAVAV